MSPTGRHLLATTAAALALATLGAPPAHAAASSETRALCASSSVPCSVQAPVSWIEGATHEVAVTGNPRVRVRVQAQRVTLDAATGRARLRPLGPTVEIRTDDHGFGAADLTLPLLADGRAGGPVLLTLADTTQSDLAQVLGTWTRLAARTPIVRGDGFARRKPVGQELTLLLEATVPGTTFDVEHADGSAWHSTGTTTTQPCGTGVPCRVGYEVPRGLTPTTHRFRLVNLRTGTPVAHWRVVPAASGTPEAPAPVEAFPPVGSRVRGALTHGAGASGTPAPRPRSRNLDVPDAAADVVGAGGPVGHRVDTVRDASALLGVAALVATLGVLRRRRG
ncbi:hypothetical protein GHK92_15140 [Nocardioides sp. dk4132]|uniref:hypothetical protein n=1 Tax=unclassified Nocardioides TaxID=2615069 RepID=UPI001297C540|nr:MULTISPECIES: hypothetical protein [unclassified Nocardioides]MQW77207.1 hypothetical protein [Nocardioides sp. dk4132]QGA07972.1 hypothetical protein GFH29_11620 [Nocardioides sp. dk884]